MKVYSSIEYIRNRFGVRDSIVRQRREIFDRETGEVKNFVARDFVGIPESSNYAVPLCKWGAYKDVK